MELLHSKIDPWKYGNRSFSEAFEVCVVNSDNIDIATGYITEESLLELKAILSFYHNRGEAKRCSLIIGMHGREGFTRNQYDASKNLAQFLKDNGLGNVYFCTAFKFHGKTYLFHKSDKPLTAILGSSNLGNLVDNRQWEIDAITSDESILSEINDLHSYLIANATRNILEDKNPPPFNESSDLLKDRIDVEKADDDAYKKAENTLTGEVFDITLSTSPKSNLNVYFGKGRESKKTGGIRPRNWYEAELIVQVDVRASHQYPQEGSIFRVLTDDGWSFKCRISGENGKNFRSDNDLSILGRWIKGRLEDARCLKIGEPVTKKVLENYGRNTISLKRTADPELWLLDFSVSVS